MKPICIAIALSLFSLSAFAAELDTIGVTLLRQIAPSLTGTGIVVGQPEAGTPTSSDWEVNPAAVGQPESLFTWSSMLGTATNYPNLVGAEGGHANAVGAWFYGTTYGVATGAAHVYNYDASYFVNTYIAPPVQLAMPSDIVNQSFVAGVNNAALDQKYDDYAAAFNVLFVSGAGNGGTIQSPASCYNGIGVAAYGGSSSIGLTPDGRSKPDITAPASVTSFSTPMVSGCAALLLQAAEQGQGGTNIAAATDIRTLKALLLNGAVKPSDWTNGASTPLDARHGAGILNVFNSHAQLSGGKSPFIETTYVTADASHPPGSNPGIITATRGWDFSSITNDRVQGNYQDKIHHYYFSLTNLSSGQYTFTATTTWLRNGSSINDLDMFLYNRSNGSLVAASTSAVDNVEHIFLPTLPAASYDLQVLKRGADPRRVTTSDQYALAFEFFAVPLSIARASQNVTLSWPIAPDGFILESTSSLNTPISWIPVNTTPIVTNNQKIVTLFASATQQFFRLRRP